MDFEQKYQKDPGMNRVKIDTKNLFKGIFDIVSLDLCLILSNLTAVQSASQSVKKSTKCSKRRFEQCEKTAKSVEKDIPHYASVLQL